MTIPEGERTKVYSTQLLGTDWRVWSRGALRTTGFPASALARLAVPACAKAADAYLAGTISKEEFEREFASGASQNSDELFDVATNELFRSAVAWQSSSSVSGLESLLRAGRESPRSKDRRRRERMVVRYWQRYCAKTETVGFFGPLVWADVDVDSEGIELAASDPLIRRLTIKFEDWALTEFSRWLSTQPTVRPWLFPVRQPHHVVHNGEVLRPGLPPMSVTIREEALLRLCDGNATAVQIADQLHSSHADHFETRDDVVRQLEVLQSRRLITWDANLPIHEASEEVLQEVIDGIQDPVARGAAAAAFDVLKAARTRVHDAATDATALTEALSNLNAAFTEITGVDANRRGGETYAGRTVAYIDAERNLSLTVGRDFLERIAQPMDILLTSARWLTVAMSQSFADYLSELFASRAKHDHSVALSDIWFDALRAFSVGHSLVLDGAVSEFRERWHSLVGNSDGRTYLELRSSDLLEKAHAIFKTDARAWATSTIHSPDLQICAHSAADLIAGDYEIVLGELHIAIPTLCGTPFDWLLDEPHSTIEHVANEQGPGRVMPALPRTWPGNTGRTSQVDVASSDWLLAFGAAPGVDLARVVPTRGVSVRIDESGTLVGKLPSGEERPLIDFFGHFLSAFASTALKAVPRGPSSPRLSIDGVTIFRRTWEVDVLISEVRSFDESTNYLALRAWRLHNDLPEQVFVKIQSETKPFLVDFQSPASVLSLAAFARSALAEANGSSLRLSISEAMPRLDQACFEDTFGNRYFGELRLQISDSKSPTTDLR